MGAPRSNLGEALVHGLLPGCKWAGSSIDRLLECNSPVARLGVCQARTSQCALNSHTGLWVQVLDPLIGVPRDLSWIAGPAEGAL